MAYLRGPLLYLIYTSDLATLLASYSALAQLVADDVQAYLHCSASDAIATTQVMTYIMGALEAWMSSNRLRLNSAKTQFIWLLEYINWPFTRVTCQSQAGLVKS